MPANAIRWRSRCLTMDAVCGAEATDGRDLPACRVRTVTQAVPQRYIAIW
jgi:hypothetical protein